MKVQVTIKDRDTFIGVVLDETTTHFLVGWEGNEKGEWFAKQSKLVNCEVKV